MADMQETEDSTAERQSCLEKLEALEKEMALLEEAQRHLGSLSHFSMKDINKCRSSLPPSSSDSGPARTSHSNDIVRLNSELELLQSVTGINIVDCKTKVLSAGTTRLKRNQLLEGDSYGITFKLLITMVETQISASEHRAKISELQIGVEENTRQSLDVWISRCEDLCDIQQFFRVFVSYAEWCSHRTKAFTYFQNEFPDAVVLPHGTEGSVMEFKNPPKPGATWILHWNVHCTEAGCVSPQLDLVIKAPKSMVKMDSEKTLEDAPEMFNQMVKSLGAAKAINTLIALVTQ